MLTRVYERLPPALQSLAASVRGRKLRALRYGPGSERQVEEALERDTWTEDRWKVWREDTLARLLHRAATHVPFYRDQWSERRRRGDKASWDVLSHWPILTKEPLRRSPESFLAEDCDPRRMLLIETSGTTGTPIRLWRSRTTEQAWYAMVEARLRRWHGITRHDPWANFGGQRVTPGSRRRPPFWVWNRPMRQLYMSTYHVSPDNVEAYLRALAEYEIQSMLVYPSAAYGLASVAIERGLAAPKMRLVVSNAEALFDFQRAAISRVFQCEVRDTYGQGEIVCAGSECASGSMHFWPDVGVTEWMRDGGPEAAGPGEAGDLVCTGLVNTDMPLIRYTFGDRAVPGQPGVACPCGRTLPVTAKIDGRIFDVIRSPSGSPVGGLDTIFHSGLPMLEAQIVQESLTRFRIHVVPAAGFGDAHREDLVAGVRARLGPEVEVTVVTVPSIARTSAGKFRVLVSLLEGSGK